MFQPNKNKTKCFSSLEEAIELQWIFFSFLIFMSNSVFGSYKELFAVNQKIFALLCFYFAHFPFPNY